MLGAAIRTLERDATVGKRRANLHDRAGIAGAHPPERCHRAVDGTEVGDLGGATILVRLDLPERSEDRCHRVVYPDIDGTELGLDALRRLLDLRRHGDVGRYGEGARPDAFDVGLRTGEAVGPSRDEAQAGA